MSKSDREQRAGNAVRPGGAAGASSPRRLIVLGSTGSIGANTLEVVEHLHRCSDVRFEVVALATGRRGDVLAAQAKRFGVRDVAIADSGGENDALVGLGRDGVRIHRGPDAALALIDSIAQPGDVVVGAMVGSAGLPAVIRAIEKGCDIALANKETLVAAGAIVMPLAKRCGVQILPVDSEHSAIFQCLACGRGAEEIRRIVLTASGGPFRNATRDAIERATVEDALNHPTWDMGAKVTIDSATLMNKALEVIEAHWLFDLDADRIDAIIHPQSIVHSFIEFSDGSVIAQLSPPDMKLPIQYALTWPRRIEGCAERMDWETLASLEFQPIDAARFPSIEMAKEVVRRGGSAGTVFNAANEVAVEAFLDRRIGFGRIHEVVAETVAQVAVREVQGLDDVFEADAEAREAARGLITAATAAAATR